MNSELIISTYNSPAYLAATLKSLAAQQIRPSSVAIADDGSGPETKAVIEAFTNAHPDLALRHVWHEDAGFRKCLILNKAIAGTKAGYLVFTDGDCIMHPTFMARHFHLAHPNRFLTGSCVRLTDTETQPILASGDFRWTPDGRLAGCEIRGLSDYLKTMPWPAPVMGILDRLSPVRPSWGGLNASTSLANVMTVNGFDETLAYGGQDKEFGVRLKNAGIKGRHLRYSAPLYHLDHGRSYKDPEIMAGIKAAIASARRSGVVWTDAGIVKS